MPKKLSSTLLYKRILFTDEMSTLNSLKKKCRQLEERGKWEDLSEIYNKIAAAYRSSREFEEREDTEPALGELRDSQLVPCSEQSSESV